jgi:uncharacterized protein YndB with AHSA1/START domain
MTSVTLVRHIAAQPSIVFKALSTSEGVAAWWGPHELPVVSARVDARFGGDYRVRFRTIDGGEHEAHGEFLDVSPPSRLVMTWKYSFGGEPEELGRMSIIEIDLRPVDGGSELTFTHSKLRNEKSRASHEAGWAGALAKLVVQLGHIPG